MSHFQKGVWTVFPLSPSSSQGQFPSYELTQFGTEHRNNISPLKIRKYRFLSDGAPASHLKNRWALAPRPQKHVQRYRPMYHFRYQRKQKNSSSRHVRLSMPEWQNRFSRTVWIGFPEQFGIKEEKIKIIYLCLHQRFLFSSSISSGVAMAVTTMDHGWISVHYAPLIKAAAEAGERRKEPTAAAPLRL